MRTLLGCSEVADLHGQLNYTGLEFYKVTLFIKFVYLYPFRRDDGYVV
jgi:hypothetical protein